MALKIYYIQVLIHFFQYSKCLTLSCIWGQIHLKNNKFTIYIQLVHEGLLAGYICEKKKCLIYTKNITLVLEHGMIKYADQHVILSMHGSVSLSLGTIICFPLKGMPRVWLGYQICYILKKFKHLEKRPCYLGMTS